MKHLLFILFLSGVSPSSKRGSRTGVFVGVTTSEAGEMWNARPARVEGVSLTGCSKSMFPNRISYAFDFNGPSGSYDTACSSSSYALEAAVSAIKDGTCDAAVVVGSSLILSPCSTILLQSLGILSQDAACKAFDISGEYSYF